MFVVVVDVVFRTTHTNRFARKRLKEKSKSSESNIHIEDVFEDGYVLL